MTRRWTSPGYSRAECDNCKWYYEAKDAVSAGSRHARKNKHLVHVVVERSTVFDYTTKEESAK